MIAENIKILGEIISAKCAATGRNQSEIKLIGISKTKPVSIITEAYAAGLIHFGENKAQEFIQKGEQVKENVIWHFVGHLQTNKVKNVISFAEYIHSVDSIKLADEINKRAENINKSQKILLEVNTSGEDAKFGLNSIEELYEVAEHCRKNKNLELIGLMTMAPFTSDKKIIRDCFIKLRKTFDELNSKQFGLTELSMGMTNDYEIAIEEGSTMLRIGTAIFGERNYSFNKGVS